MVAYADTSFLVSLYGRDANSSRAGTIAAALALGAQAFFTFDTRQKDLAVKAGFEVKP
jgi:hypothetical protein